MKRGARAIKFIQDYCRIPEGRDVGKPVRLRPWQKTEVRRIYDNPAGTRRAILSFGRKNAKSTLSAFILLLHLCGPEAKANSQLYSTAQSKDQASILFKLAAKIIRLSPDLHAVCQIRDTIREIACPPLGTLYKALSAEVSTAYGLSPVLTIHDELGQVEGPRSELYEALETAVGAHEQPLSIIISTQAPTDADLLSVLIDDAMAGNDPRTVVSLYTADPALDPFSDEAIRAANPAFGDFLNAKEVKAMAADARRMPSREAQYRNLVLNQRVEVNSPFIGQVKWDACRGDVTDFAGLPVFGGLDLSATTDLTALVLIAPHQGQWHVRPTFWLPSAGLAEKARSDRVPYDVWQKQGFLATTPGASIEYEFVAEHLWRVFQELDVQTIGFDEWNFRHLKPWLERAGFGAAAIEQKFMPVRQSYRDMAPALRVLESRIEERKLIHDGNPVLTMCARNAVVVSDGKDNRMLTKRKSRGRIDGMVALANAIAAAGTFEPKPQPSYEIHIF